MPQSTDPKVGESTAPAPNTMELERLWRAVLSGDTVAAQSLCSADVVMRVPGRSQIAGSYRGPEGVVAYFAALQSLSGGTAVTTVENVASAPGKAVVTQKVRAKRGQRELTDSQNVLLRIQGARVAEAFVYPHDLRAHDAFWGRAPLFTPEDRDLIADAIRAGSTPPPDPNARKRVIIWFGVAVGVFLLTLVSFNWLNSHYSAQRLSATTTDLSSVQHVVVGHPGSKGSWNLEHAVVEGASFEHILGEVLVELPISSERCGELAQELKETCTGRTITVAPPFEFRWSDPARLTKGTEEVARLDLEIEMAREEASATRMTLVTSSQQAPNLCFSEPPSKIEVRMVDGDGDDASETVRPGTDPLLCEDGVQLRVRDMSGADPLVGPTGSNAQASSIVLASVSQLNFNSLGTNSDLDGLAGRLSFFNLDKHVFNSAAHVISNSAESSPINTVITLGETGGRLSMNSDEVRSVLTDDGELLPTVWERLPQPLLALYGSLVTALVLPALIAFLQLARDRVLLGRRHHT